MGERRRARADQMAHRINTAVALLASGLEVVEAARRLAGRHSISERQARRYVEQARDEGEVDVPSAKVAFTVKLPGDLARRVRRQAKRSGQTISSFVAHALQEFLEKLGASSRGDG